MVIYILLVLTVLLQLFIIFYLFGILYKVLVAVDIDIVTLFI